MQTSDCRILWRTAAKKIQAFLQGSGIAPDGFRLFRAGTDQGLGHGPGHLGRSSRRSEDMRVVIVMMIVPFFLMVGAAGKQGDALAAVGFAGFGLGQAPRPSTSSTKRTWRSMSRRS